MRIVGVEQCRFAIPSLIRQQYDEWKHLNTTFSYSSFMEWANKIIPNHENNSGMDRMFIAVDDAQVLGSIALIKDDMDYPMYSPWLAGLYVFPQHRKNGVATKLVEYLIEHCRNRGYIPLHLTSEHKWLDEWYERKFGFHVESHDQQNGHPVTYMRLDK